MTELLNPVVLSVLTLIALSLSRVNVILALLLAAVVGGVTAGLGITETFAILIEGLGGQGETALSYILLGTMAVVVSRSGITQRLVDRVLPLLSGKRAFVLFSIAGLACFSQNLIPVHIAFIPILIPPLLSTFNRLGIDRRAVATALTFGLKAPYLLIPVGFGLIFQTIVVDAMNENGMEVALSEIPLAMAIPVGGMALGLCVAILISYRKNRVYATAADDADPATPSPAVSAADSSRRGWPMKDIVVLASLAVALVLQLVFESLVIAALGGLLVIFIFRAERWRDGDDVVAKGVAMMGTIAFIMLVASGYAQVLTETGAVEDLVAGAAETVGDSQLLAAVTMMLVGLLVTMGIGTSFGTVPVLGAIFVPICAALGFSPLATAALIGASGAIGDAGAPASDSTLGPTSGLNADGQHNHIWDTCVPTFLHYNIPLFLGGIIAALVL